MTPWCSLLLAVCLLAPLGDAAAGYMPPETCRESVTTITYTWTSDNRLQSVSDGATKVSYGYDALGRRISRTEESGANKTETQWLLDTARPYSEIITERTRANGGAWQTTSYTHTPDGVGLLIAENKQA